MTDFNWRINWREVDEIRLRDRTIPNPNNTSDQLSALYGVRILIDGPLIHIDPRSTANGQKRDDTVEFEVHAIPGTSVDTIRYRMSPELAQAVDHNGQ